jgi:N-acetylmuramoyl-L-alanine amidase
MKLPCRALSVLTVLTLVFGAGLGEFAHASLSRKQEARSQFDKAEQMREALNGRPTGERTRREYQRVADAYRRVYYVAPASSKADASVVAVAEVLAEMGRQFEPGEKDLRAAIAQYEFLSREYPGSKYRIEALFTIGQIYKEDLGDTEAARKSFQEFLKHYPHTSLAREAKLALAELNAPSPKKKTLESAQGETRETPVAVEASLPTVQKKSALPMVTGIRHWSTPDYTRVAIDVDGEVKYEAGRVADPDRIFFDLPDTKLASTLVGKSFAVEDGFLKKIRVAQYHSGATRVVLEVDDVSDYSAFLLPNPYRLIIDIHGSQPHTGTQVAKANPSSAAANEDETVDQPGTASSRSIVTGNLAPSPNAKSAKDGQLASKNVSDFDEGQSSAPQAKGLSAASSKSGKSKPRKVIVDQDDDVTTTPSGVSAASATGPTVDNSATFTPQTQDATAPKHETPAPSTSGKKTKTGESIVARSDNPNDPLFAGHADTNVPELKATTQPTTAPTAVAIAPRAKEHSSKKTSKAAATEVSATHEAEPTAAGDRSLIRALGLKIGRIVIDAGHGGHDTGTIGPNGLLEKDLVLDVALRLGRLLETRMGADVIYTRDDDTFIPLETRTAVANEHQADLFISVHANSSPDPAARGVETYYLNFTSNADALEVAARENAVSQKSIHELQDLVKKITLKEKIDESRELASDVQQSLYAGLAGRNSNIRDRGVKKAPFVVLIGANMPSILAEISFVSNPTDEIKLETPEYREKIADSLYKGISKYVGGLSGVKVATKFGKNTGE